MTESEKTKRVFIIEPNSSGHHFYYVKLLAEEVLSKSHPVNLFLFTTSASMDSSEFTIHLANIKKLTIICLPLEELSLRRLSGNTLLENATWITFPDSDRLLTQIAIGHWQISSPTTFLVMRPDGERRRVWGLGLMIGIAKKSLIALNNLRTNVHVFALKSPLSRRKLPLPWVSDPITLTDTQQKIAEYRKVLNSKPPTHWVGVFGYITLRKNLDLIVDAIADDQSLGLFVAGSIDQDVMEIVEHQLQRLQDDERLINIAGPLDDNALDSAIASVDVVVAAHSNDGPSGIVSKAAALGKPVALAGAKSLRLDARNLGKQARWTKLNSKAIYQSVKSLIESDPVDSIHLRDEVDFLKKLLP